MIKSTAVLILATTLLWLGACTEPEPTHDIKRYPLDDGFAYVEEFGGGREGVSLTVLKGMPSLVATYHEDKAHGPVMVFDKAGRPKELTTFNQGILEGDWRCWAPSGERIQWGQFRANEMHGTWMLGDKKSVYESGKLISGEPVVFDALCGRGALP